MDDPIDKLLGEYYHYDFDELGEDAHQGHHHALKAKQAIKDLMLDIVGEDEPEEVSGEQIPESWHRNKLRQQLRQKIEEL